MDAMRIVRRKMSRATSPVLGTDGSAAAEFAVILLVLFVLVIGLYELGRLYWIRNTIQFAAEQTGRCVMVASSPGVSTMSSGSCAYTNYLSGLTGVTLDASSGCTSSVCLVVLNYTFSFGSIWSRLANISLTGKSQVPIG